MKTALAITKSRANAMRQTDSGLTAMPYSAGKFEWKGTQAQHIDGWNAEAVQTSDDVAAIYFEQGRDSHGDFVRAMCLVRNTERVESAA